VTNTAKTIVVTVAEHTVCLILASVRKLCQSVKAAREGKWRIPEYHFRELRGKAVGLLGFGNISRAVVQRLSGWECTITAYDPYVEADEMKSLGVKKSRFDELLATSDIVSLHLPLLDSTKEIMGERAFSLMKPDAFFINTSRGKLVDERALVKALIDGKLAGAAVDVLYEEPIALDNPLISLKNVIITPHNAGTADESMILTARQATKNCVDALLGKQPEFIANVQGLPKWRERFLTFELPRRLLY
jgi:D-3-phosphoglycerate dehydrogenase